MQKILSKARVVGILEQADWATVGTITSTYEAIYVDAETLKKDGNVIVSGFEHTSGTGLLPERSRRYTDANSGLGRVSFTMTATKRNLALLFAGALGKATEVATTPFQKIITPLYETVVPNYAGAVNKEPHLFSIAIKQGALGDGILTCAIVDKLNFIIDYNARGVTRLAKVNVEFVGIWNRAQDFSGATFTATDEVFYNDAALFTIDESQAISATYGGIKSIKLSINNSVTTSSLGAGGLPLDYDVEPNITFSATFSDITGYETLYEAFELGTEHNFVCASGTTGVSGFLQFDLYGRMINNDFAGSADGYDENTITIECEKPASGSCCTVTIADAVDRNWIAP